MLAIITTKRIIASVKAITLNATTTRVHYMQSTNLTVFTAYNNATFTSEEECKQYETAMQSIQDILYTDDLMKDDCLREYQLAKLVLNNKSAICDTFTTLYNCTFDAFNLNDDERYAKLIILFYVAMQEHEDYFDTEPLCNLLIDKRIELLQILN